MGSSCSRACTSWKERNSRRCLLVGLDNAGKTTLLNTLCHNGKTETEPTVGFNTETVKVKKLSLDIWDVGGQEMYRPMWRHYFAGSHAVVFVIDSTDVARMETVKQEMQRLAINDQLRDTVWLVFANKQDEQNAMHSSQIESVLDLKDLLKDHTYKLMESVATKDIGVKDG
ncbi:hypothetical protein WA577_003577, partial [Blastocystis sp. JDR]